MPRVAVITASYNSAEFIEQTVRSVLQQTLTDFEYIIVDDGSTDGTPDLLRQLAAGDSRLRPVFRSTPSGGPTVPKNLALSLVTAPYVCLLDHDDYYAPDKLQRLADGLDAHPDWVAAFHDVQLVDGALQPHPGTYLSNVDFPARAGAALSPIGGNWYHCGRDFYKFMSLNFAAMHTVSVMLAPGRLLQDPISFKARYRGGDDTDLWLRVAHQGNIGYLDEVLSFYRLHGNNLSGDTVAMTQNAIRLHEDNFRLASDVMTPAELAAYRDKINGYQLDLAYKLGRQRRFREANAICRGLLRSGVVAAPLNQMARLAVKRMLPQRKG